MENIFDIKDGVLVKCQVNQADVIIPDGVRIVSSEAFKKPDSHKGVDELVRIVLPESVTTIQSGAFKYCENLRKVTILGPADIEAEAFVSCHHLEEVYLADGVKSIGSRCFSFCAQLKQLYIPESVERIGWEIAEMNDSSYIKPIFICYRKGIGADWDYHWNKIYTDPRWNDENHTSYHMVFWGMTREGKERTEDIKPIEVTDMPHGTGIKIPDTLYKGKKVRLPKITLRLWLTATRLENNKEYALTEEEQEALSNILQVTEDHVKLQKHPLNTPWEKTIEEDNEWGLTKEVDIEAWINLSDHPFDGKTITISHDMPEHHDPYEKYPVSMLSMGKTIIAERMIIQNNATYDVRLHIEWPNQEIQKHSLKNVLNTLSQVPKGWANYNDDKHEIHVYLAHGTDTAKEYNVYRPSMWPKQFLEEFQSDLSAQNNLSQIVVQPMELYEVTHSYSSDYCDAAEAYGVDCSDWTSTERRNVGKKLSFEIQS